jgi:uncharacterized protein (DUF1697 family)
MTGCIALLRGINVGGRNKISMAELKKCMEELGLQSVVTYISSGNVIFESDLRPSELQGKIEDALVKNFKLDSELIKVLILSGKQLQTVIDHKPKGFGEQTEKYYSDAIFLMDIGAAEALSIFVPREGVDTIWPGEGVIYSQRLGAERTKSRLGRIAASPLYKSMTIRSWNTTTKLLEILKARDDG